jgi:hypothetical protein
MLVLCRTALAALLLLSLAARRGELAPLRRRLLPLAAFAGVEIAVPWIALIGIVGVGAIVGLDVRGASAAALAEIALVAVC